MVETSPDKPSMFLNLDYDNYLRYLLFSRSELLGTQSYEKGVVLVAEITCLMAS